MHVMHTISFLMQYHQDLEEALDSQTHLTLIFKEMLKVADVDSVS